MYFSPWGSQAWVFWLLLHFCSAILILSRPSFIQSCSFLYLQQHLSFTLNYQETKMDGSFHFSHTKIRGLKAALTAVMNSLFKEAAQDISGSLNSLNRKWAEHSSTNPTFRFSIHHSVTGVLCWPTKQNPPPARAAQKKMPDEAGQ